MSVGACVDAARAGKALDERLNILWVFAAMVFIAAPVAAQVQLPELNQADPIAISAQAGNQWQVGSYEVWVLRGNCTIQQGNGCARGREAVLWIDRAPFDQQRPTKVIAYLEGDVSVAFSNRPDAARIQDQTWFGRFSSSGPITVESPAIAGKPDVLPPVYWRGMERRSPDMDDSGWRKKVQPAQYVAPSNVQPGAQPGVQPTNPPTSDPAIVAPMTPVKPQTPALSPIAGPKGLNSMPTAGRRIRMYPRSDVPVQVDWQSDPTGQHSIAVIAGGVNIIVDGLEEYGTIDVMTDRLVIWTKGMQNSDLNRGVVQDQREQLEFYMEGNIVFRQGERTIYADRMYYDVPNNVGTVLNADMLTPVCKYEGLLRLHAEVLQQTAKDRYFAQNAYVTSSRMGEPGYRLQSGDMYFEDIQQPVVDPATGQPAVDQNGQPVFEHQRLISASNNFVFAGPVPVFYWPTMAADVTDPTYYIRRVRFKQDKVFGTQFLTQWSGYELLGIRHKPVGTDFSISLDYLSDRGFGHGMDFHYDRDDFFDIPGHTAGLFDAWGIQDHGYDNLGKGRRRIKPEESYRYRVLWQHRQLLPYDIQLSAELGVISDRNFLEEYYKSEWEELKDPNTGIELKRTDENRSLSLSVDYGLNDFVTHTDWLPRLDHFWVGQSLFNDTFTWYEHSSAAYARFNKLTAPKNANDQPFSYLPWEADSRQGERFATRQEIDWPFQLGAVKVVPYMMGELAHWGQDLNGEPLDRAWGQVGVRASLPMWSVDPTINSELLNINGLAHKITFEMEFSAADANKDMDSLPLYDALDDDSVEAFRRRFATYTFGWPSTIPATVAKIPQRFDERYYALRYGLQNWVTSSNTEIADDLMACRLGVNQRWQTKRGPASNPHIIDWITFNTNMTIYPNPDRDNYGQVFGLLDYDFRWHVGDRLTLVSDAIFDFFNDGQKIVTVGGFLSRPPRGSLYLGFRVLEGPIHHDIIALSYSYWMSPKWVTSFGTSVDVGNNGNIGQHFSIMRVGESFLVSAGFTVDAARNNVGAVLSIEPRFVSKNRLSNTTGAEIPPAGVFGLE